MTTKTVSVNRWGNGLGIRLPKEFIDKAGITETSRVEVSEVDGKLVIMRAKEARRHIPPCRTIKRLGWHTRRTGSYRLGRTCRCGRMVKQGDIIRNNCGGECGEFILYWVILSCQRATNLWVKLKAARNLRFAPYRRYPCRGDTAREHFKYDRPRHGCSSFTPKRNRRFLYWRYVLHYFHGLTRLSAVL